MSAPKRSRGQGIAKKTRSELLGEVDSWRRSCSQQRADNANLLKAMAIISRAFSHEDGLASVVAMMDEIRESAAAFERERCAMLCDLYSSRTGEDCAREIRKIDRND